MFLLLLFCLVVVVVVVNVVLDVNVIVLVALNVNLRDLVSDAEFGWGGVGGGGVQSHNHVKPNSEELSIKAN